ncbi:MULTISPECIES: tellurite resistance TerB family protein [unclassified Pseudomonas]|jgi:tellurite resistance protein TerB|uniref:tellurite resistance TerB family protein n=1 Tax=unclassified Pseudomonas TaxID=196821 RepID=UPI00026F71D8|nr:MULTISPECIES: tellurite resistance TerB family protein [unclassified Pseudomonas]EJN28027.1 tellurite resistance protein [Pseudomonas sp. GM80]KAE9641050.1 Tellurite resistance TerB [Pseudomonas sp. PB103]
MFAWLKENAAIARDKLTSEVSKFKNQKFMDAVTAACALVASADGEISSAEKTKMAGFISNSPELKVFNMADVIKSFNGHCEKFEFDYQIGQAEALKTIGKIKNDAGAGRLLVRVACAIGASDGNFDDKEKAACRQICLELGLSPADFEL